MTTPQPFGPSPREARPGDTTREATPSYEAEITIRILGWESGSSEVAITIPERSGFGAALDAASVADAAHLYGQLGARVSAELRDAFASLRRAALRPV